MAERHYVGLYWEDRPATKAECATLILAMLETVRAHDPVLSRWYLKLGTREESLASELTQASARETLLRGITPTVDDVPSFGWKVSLWNGRGEGQSAHFDVSQGEYPQMLFNPTPNSCILYMPRGRELAEIAPLLRRERMTLLLAELARSWRADWGVVSTDSYLYGKPPARPPHHPRVGWLTFLNGWRGAAPRIPGTHVMPVDGLGYIVATRDDEFTRDDGAATDRVEHLEDALQRAKRLAPVGPSDSPPSDADPPRTTATRDSYPGGDGYPAAVDVAMAVDALSCALPARRGDLIQSLLVASTALVVALATGENGARGVAELRALLDLAERLCPDAGADDLASARSALDRVMA